MGVKVLASRMEEVAEEAFPNPLFIYAPLATAPQFQMGMGTHVGLLPVGLTPTAVVFRTYGAQFPPRCVLTALIRHVNRRDVPVARLYHMDDNAFQRYRRKFAVDGMNDVARELRRIDGT